MRIFLNSGEESFHETTHTIRTILQNQGNDVATDPNSLEAKRADLLVLDAHKDSVRLGYRIGAFLTTKRPVLVLHPKETELHGFAPDDMENAYQYLTVKGYTEETVEKILKGYLANLNTNMRRFNFFISPDLDEYLSWVPYIKHVSRAEFVRDLIRETMENDTTYLNRSKDSN